LKRIDVRVYFYPKVTTLRSDLCYGKSVCHLSVVCNVRAPYSVVETFDSISSSLCTLAIFYYYYYLLLLLLLKKRTKST